MDAVLVTVQPVLQNGSLSYPASALSNGPAMESKEVRLERIWVYPIKSCGGFCPRAWPLGTRGLLWDREWALVDASGVALTQKQCPRLATVSTTIDLASRAPRSQRLPTWSAGFSTHVHRLLFMLVTGTGIVRCRGAALASTSQYAGLQNCYEGQVSGLLCKCGSYKTRLVVSVRLDFQTQVLSLFSAKGLLHASAQQQGYEADSGSPDLVFLELFPGSTKLFRERCNDGRAGGLG